MTGGYSGEMQRHEVTRSFTQSVSCVEPAVTFKRAQSLERACTHIAKYAFTYTGQTWSRERHNTEVNGLTFAQL